MKLREFLMYASITLLSIAFFLKSIVPAWQTVHSDFANYYVSSKLIKEKKDSLFRLYDNAWFQQQISEQGINTRGKFAPFPPITAFVMIPLTVFNPLTAQRIFTIINICFVGLGIYFVRRIAGWSWAHSTLLTLTFGWSLFNNIAFGQLYLIIAVSLLAAFTWIERDKSIVAGVVMGSFVMLKYFPIVFVFSFLVIGLLQLREKNNWQQNEYLKATISAIVTTVVLIVFQIFFFGQEVFKEFINSAFLPHLNSELKGQGMFSYEFQSWDSLLRNLFVFDPSVNPKVWIDWPEGKLVCKLLIIFLILGTGALTMIRCRNSSRRKAVFISVPALAALVLLPASATYHFIFLLPAVIYLIVDSAFNERLRIVLAIFIFTIGFIPYHFLQELSKSWGIVLAYPRLILITALFALVVFELNRHEAITK